MTNFTNLFNYLANLTLVLLIVIFLLASDVQAQQGGSVAYGYDDNGRLISVTLPTGESVTYSYDPAGNITNIQRLTGPGPQFFSFTPLFGFVNDTVTFNGNNFSSITSVSFNGTNATVFSGNLTQIIATVPSGATTGQITVTLSNGTFTTATFSVLALQVTPSLVSVLPNQSQRFNSIVPSQLGNINVIWSVNGVNGGNSTVGTISSSGLYLAPNTTTAQTFTVKATSVARPTAFAQATVKVSPELFQTRSSLTVLYKPEAAVNVTNVSQLTILKGIFNTNLQNFLTRSEPLSVTNGPVINTITPSTFSRNTTSAITLVGSNLAGTSTLIFINQNGQLDTSIVVSNVSVAPDGNSLTATLTVSSSSATGTRIVVIPSATSGNSTTSNNTTNTISIIP